MSTRGCVSVPWKRGWKGVYNHSDSYATGLVKELWDYLQERIKQGTLDKFPEELLESGRWEVLLEKERYDGKKYEKEKDDVPMTHKNKDNDALFTEWVYVVDIKKKQIEIYNHFDTGKKYLATRDDGTKYESYKYDWVRTAIVNLMNEAPDWDKLEKGCLEIAEGFYADKTI